MSDGAAVGPPGLVPPVAPGRRIFRNTLLNGGSSLLALGLGFILVPIAIDRLGSEAYSIWVLIVSFSVSTGYLSMADLGLQQSVVKFVSEASGSSDKEQIDRVASSAFLVFCGLAIVAVLLLALLATQGLQWLNIPANLHTAARFLLALVGFEALLGLPALAFIGTLEGLQRYGYIRLVDLFRQVAYSAWAVGALLSDRGVVAFAAALAVSGAIGALGYYVAARHAVPGLSVSLRNVDLSTVRRLVHFGGWVFVGKLNGVLWRQMDKLILATVVASTVLASYNIAYQIQASAAAVLSITASAIMPAASAFSATKDRYRLQQLLLRGTRYTMVLSLPIVIGAMLMAKPFIEHWVGPEFVGVADAARLFLVYQFLASAASIANTMLFGLGQVKLITLYATIATVVNLVVSIVLARSWGIEGVITGTLVGHGIVTPLYVRRMMRELDISLLSFVRETIGKLLPWAVVYGVALQVIKSLVAISNLFMVFLECAAALAIYAAGVFLVAMSDEERRTVIGFFKRTEAA